MPTAAASKTPALRFWAWMFLALWAFSPANARSSTGIPWNSESWMGLPQMATFSTCFRSTPRFLMTLFTVSIRMSWASPLPTLMQKVRWSMMFAPGRG